MRWSVVIPVFNERDYLSRTLRSLARQQRRFRLIVVDNRSDDGSGELARRLIEELGLDGEVVFEPNPGAVPALARGLSRVETELVATCDADTYYPRHYLEAAERLLDARRDAAMASAWYVPPRASRGRAAAAALHQLGAARLLPRQAHNGAAGQCFRMEALRARGGYRLDIWPFVLGDHEIVHRVLKAGRQVWGRDLWCAPSDRRRDPDAVRWSLGERLLYHATPFALKDWYFYDFLRPRFERRGMDSARLRERDWTELNGVAPYPVC